MAVALLDHIEETSMSPAPSRRLNVDLDPETYEALRAAVATDGVSISDRIRGLVALWLADPTVSAAANDLASEIAVERRKRKAAQ